MRELNINEVHEVAGGLGDRTASAAMAISQETPNVGFWAGTTLMAFTGVLGLAFSIGVTGLVAFSTDFH